MFPVSFLVISFLLLSSCVSTHTALQNIEHGLSKQGVRNTIGKPFSVGRSDGLDRWTYKFRWNSQEYTRDIFFDEGQVQKIGPVTPYPNYEKKMTEAEDLEEYEINATLYQRQKEAGFREINSLKKKDSDDVVQFCSDVFWSDTAEQQCKDIMRGHRFATTALDFCTDNGIWLDFHKLDCLEIIANKLFNENDLMMCSIPAWAISKLRCLNSMTALSNLSIIEDNKKNDIIIFNCSDEHDVQFKLQFPEETKEASRSLSPMRSTRIDCGLKFCLSYIEDPTQLYHGRTPPPPRTLPLPIKMSLPENSRPLKPYLEPGQIYTLTWNPENQLWNFSMETGSIICD